MLVFGIFIFYLKNTVMLEKIKKITEEFFSKLKVEVDNIEVKQEDENIFFIKLETNESHFLIWTHWKNLDVITNILKLILLKNLWENIVIHLEVNDYLESKDKKLFRFIESKIRIVEKTGKDVRLPFLTAYERKKVHSFVSDLNNDLFTKSEWEWKNRRLFIWKEEKKLTIDIDWSDI